MQFQLPSSTTKKEQFLIMISKLVANIEKQHRALKLRIYPNEQQELLINKTFGCCRQIYNNRLFKTVNLKGSIYKLMFVVSLLDSSRPKLLSFYKVDFYEEIHDGDTILYEGGQQTKVKLSKGESNTTD